MSYDLHGAWNDHVGHNAALFDTGKDSELAQWNVYGTAAYGGIGYLNRWIGLRHFRGSMPAGRNNIGALLHSWSRDRWLNGLWGRAALPNQAECSVRVKRVKNNCGHMAQLVSTTCARYRSAEGQRNGRGL